MASYTFVGVKIRYSDGATGQSRQVILDEDLISKFHDISFVPEKTDSGATPLLPVDSGDRVFITIQRWWDSTNQYYTIELPWGSESTPIDYYWWTTDQYFSQFMGSFVFVGSFAGGTQYTYSPINAPIVAAKEVIDGDEDTYITIGKNGTRYVMHDFGGNLDAAIFVKKIQWVVTSDVIKTYQVEAYDGVSWQIVYTGIVNPGEKQRKVLIWDEAQTIYAVRVVHTGDYSTSNPTVDISISNIDEGYGTTAYRISRRPDFRDAAEMPGSDVDGWIPTTNGTLIVNYNLIPEQDNWINYIDTGDTLEDFNCIINFNGSLLIGCNNGDILYAATPDAATTLAGFSIIFNAGAAVNCFLIDNDVLLAATSDGKIYKATTPTAWQATPVVTLTIPTAYVARDGILSMASHNGLVYIGTDFYNLYSADPDDSYVVELIDTMTDLSLDAMASYDGKLYFGTAPSGKIYRYDGISISQELNTKLSSWSKFTVFSKDNLLYAGGDDGITYRRNESNWSLFYDAIPNMITDVLDFVAKGPSITLAYDDGEGNLVAGTYLYAITYVDAFGVESLIGDTLEADVNSAARGSILLEWEENSEAQTYNIYRTEQNDQGAALLRQLISGITTTTYRDDGTIQTSSKQSPLTSEASLWLSGDNGAFYVYFGDSLTKLTGPTELTYVTAMSVYSGNIFVIGRDSSNNSLLYRFSGIVPRSGMKSIYVQSKDGLGNVSEVISDDIYVDMLYDKALITIDAAGDLVSVYEDTSANRYKFSSPHYDPYVIGSYESEPFYVATLSVWQAIQYLALLSPGTSVELWVRTADTRSDVLEAEWYGPASDIHQDSEYEYDPSELVTNDIDLTTLKGNWIQYKVILKSWQKGNTPWVYNVTLTYSSTNAAFFFSDLFDLETMGIAEDYESVSDIIARRGVLTYNGSYPTGGYIQFGITTESDSYDWSDYQVITPNNRFEIASQKDKFRVGILLVSTDSEAAIVDEWAMMFDSGPKFIRVNEHYS